MSNNFRYYQQSAPFWDFIAGLEEQGSNHPFFARGQQNEDQNQEQNNEEHDSRSGLAEVDTAHRTAHHMVATTLDHTMAIGVRPRHRRPIKI
ncbi:hypothetical protein LTR53_018920 [Teratosphaeriaceae sp. CCFEE 6253]|nr:hypothetical protein LTR53_018920 [Teratosphaeriaceae sp. CCFEE 6253]